MEILSTPGKKEPKPESEVSEEVESTETTEEEKID